jgi:hypothetical protein
MDTSKEYIKMCDCEEIQKGWIPCYGDCLAGEWLNNDDEMEWQELGIVLEYNREKNTIYNGGDIHWNRDVMRWLPRQDQLQKMVNWSDIDTTLHFVDMYDNGLRLRYDSKNGAENLRGNSFEQLWLAFVMKEKHNKTWNGEKWQ